MAAYVVTSQVGKDQYGNYKPGVPVSAVVYANSEREAKGLGASRLGVPVELVTATPYADDRSGGFIYGTPKEGEQIEIATPRPRESST